MGLFGKKKNDMTKTNEMNKQQIISEITGIMRNSRGEATAMLKDLQLEMQSHGSSDSVEVTKQDALILSLLKEVNAAVIKGQESMVITKLSQVKAAVAERKINCSSGGQLTKADAKRAREQEKTMRKLGKHGVKVEKTRSEELQDMISVETAMLDDLQRQLLMLRDRHQKNPNDRAIISQAQTVQLKMKLSKEKIDSYTVELQREDAANVLIETDKTNSELTKGRTHSADELEVLASNLDAANAAKKETMEQTASYLSRLGQNDAFGSMTDPFAMDNGVSFADPFAEVGGAGTAAFGTQASGQKKTQYGGFDASSMGTSAMANDINRTKQSIQQSMDTYNDKMEDASDELNDLNAQLKPLLLRREKASPSECMVLDGQIDQLNAKRNSVQYTIKRYRQTLATLQEQLSLIEKLSTQQDLDATNAKIQQMTGGKFSDFEGLAMFLKDSVARSNEQLDEIGTAGMVADSEEINMNTFSGSSAVFSDTAGDKDESKYDALKKDLGLMS